MTLADLYDNASAADVAALPIAVHKALQDEYAALQARTKRIANVLDAGLALAYGGQNEPGTSHVKRDGYDVKVSVPKRVKYDAGTLEKLAADNAVSEYIDWKPSVSETRYKGAPEAVRTELDKARTVEMGKASFEIKEVE